MRSLCYTLVVHIAVTPLLSKSYVNVCRWTCFSVLGIVESGTH